MLNEGAAYNWTDKVYNPLMMWTPHVYLAHNVIYESTYVLHIQHQIRKLFIFTNLWSSVFYGQTNQCNELNGLPWIKCWDV